MVRLFIQSLIIKVRILVNTKAQTYLQASLWNSLKFGNAPKQLMAFIYSFKVLCTPFKFIFMGSTYWLKTTSEVQNYLPEKQLNCFIFMNVKLKCCSVYRKYIYWCVECRIHVMYYVFDFLSIFNGNLLWYYCHLKLYINYDM